MVRFLSLLLVGLIALVVLRPQPAPDRTILFIGNSFTFKHDVPGMVQRIAATSDTPVRYEVHMHVRGGTALYEHLKETDPIASIQSRDWDVVVLQDASAMAFHPSYVDLMEDATATLASAAKTQGADILYYAHWAPAQERQNETRAVRQIERAYEEISRQTGGDVAHAGRLWDAAKRAGISGLYAADDHHASPKGAYAAALAIVASLGDVDPASSRWAPKDVSSTDQAHLTRLLAHLGGPRRIALD
ncbi:MAG: hypothetical protein AAFY31_05960 [Pseudomonadota bacterium]